MAWHGMAFHDAKIDIILHIPIDKDDCRLPFSVIVVVVVVFNRFTAAVPAAVAVMVNSAV